jgi:hypothetical protein
MLENATNLIYPRQLKDPQTIKDPPLSTAIRLQKATTTTTIPFASVPNAPLGSLDSKENKVLYWNVLRYYVPMAEPIVPPKEPESVATKTRIAKHVIAEFEANTILQPVSPSLPKTLYGPTDQTEIKLSDDNQVLCYSSRL